MNLIEKWFGVQDEETVLTAQAKVGALCANWLNTDVGRYVVGRAEQYEMDVLRELATVKPEDKLRIVQLQERAKVPALIVRFLDEAIADGEAAKFQLKEE